MPGTQSLRVERRPFLDFRVDPNRKTWPEGQRLFVIRLLDGVFFVPPPLELVVRGPDNLDFLERIWGTNEGTSDTTGSTCEVEITFANRRDFPDDRLVGTTPRLTLEVGDVVATMSDSLTLASGFKYCDRIGPIAFAN